MEISYRTGYIYKLICSETGDCYFGSTFNPIKRYSSHLSNNNTCTSKCLKNPIMYILEIKDFISKSHLEYIERDYILNNNCINKNVPKQTAKEWYKRKIEKNPNYHKEKYKQNGGTLRNIITHRECECGGRYCQRNLKTHLGTLKHKKYVSNI